MNSRQLVFVIAGLSLIACSCAEGIESRKYLPVAVSVAQRKFFKPNYNEYQPQYTPSYCQLYSNGGYQQQSLGQQGTGLGGYQSQALGQQITSAAPLGGGGYQRPGLNTQISSGTTLDLSGIGLINYYPNLNLDLVTSLKPISNALNGNYAYGKKK